MSWESPGSFTMIINNNGDNDYDNENRNSSHINIPIPQNMLNVIKLCKCKNMHTFILVLENCSLLSNTIWQNPCYYDGMGNNKLQTFYTYMLTHTRNISPKETFRKLLYHYNLLMT